MKLEITYRATDELIPYINNARTHTETQVNQIASSIKEFGFNNPILLDGENGVIAGHGRLLAAQKLNLDEVPTIDLSHLSESQRKAYILADNKIALNSGWDEELLKLEIESLSDRELELTGFTAEELNLLFKGWESDIEIPDKDPSNSMEDTLRIKVNKEEMEFARETITNALDSAGIEYSL